MSLAQKLKPDVILMDVSMPVLNGIDATREITASDAGVRVIAHSLHEYTQIRAEMYQAGASAYVLKENIFEELPNVIRAVTSARKS